MISNLVALAIKGGVIIALLTKVALELICLAVVVQESRRSMVERVEPTPHLQVVDKKNEVLFVVFEVSELQHSGEAMEGVFAAGM